MRIVTYIFFSIVLFMVSHAEATTYFHHTAETTPLDNGGNAATSYLWTRCQSLVTQSATQAKNGTYSLRMEMDAPPASDQTGKCWAQFNSPLATGEWGFREAYYSAYFYLSAGFTDGPSAPDEGVLKNNMQFLTRNREVTVQGGVKIVIGFDILNEVRQVKLSIKDHEIPSPATAFPQYDWAGGGLTQIYQQSPQSVPLNTWIHLEVYLLAADPNRQGGQSAQNQAPGHIIVWQDGTEIFNLTHANLNTLTNDVGGGSWSDNAYLFWGIGAYGPNRTNQQVIFTDDAKVTDFQVSETPPASCGITSSTSWTNTGMENQTGSFTWDFDATPSQANMAGVVGLSDGAASAFTDLAVIIAFDSDGTIKARNGGAYDAENTITYSAGTEYSISATVNLSAHTYSATVGATTLATDYAFRTEQASVTDLNNWGIQSATGSVRVCSVTAVPTTGTFTQTRFQCFQFWRTSEDSPVTVAGENQDCSVAPQSRFMLRIKIRCQTNDPGGQGFVLRYSKNAGVYTALTDTFAAGIKASGLATGNLADGTATTELLTSDETTNVAGQVRLTADPIFWDCSLDSEGEHEWGIQFDNTVVIDTDVFCFKVYKSDGTELDDYPEPPGPPCVSIIDYQAGGAF